jgi:hypothetical protein
MKRLAPLGLAFGLATAMAFTGCASSDGGNGDGDGSGMPEEPEAPKTDATGMYRVKSTFDLATNMPASPVNSLMDATDDADDPASWLVDQILAGMQDGALKTILQGAKPFVIGYLNDRLTSIAPDLVETITELGNRTKEMMQNFGLNERLEVNPASGPDPVLGGRMTADGVRFTVQGVTTELVLVDNNIDNAVAEGFSVFVEGLIESNSRMKIGDHALALPYGKIMRLGLDKAVIPSMDPTADSLVDVLDNAVNCANVGQDIADALDFGSASFWASACVGGLTVAADEVYNQLAADESKLTFSVAGEARVQDTNMDYKLDKLSFGTWAGKVTYDVTDAPLSQPAVFEGNRM